MRARLGAFVLVVVLALVAWWTRPTASVGVPFRAAEQPAPVASPELVEVAGLLEAVRAAAEAGALEPEPETNGPMIEDLFQTDTAAPQVHLIVRAVDGDGRLLTGQRLSLASPECQIFARTTDGVFELDVAGGRGCTLQLRKRDGWLIGGSRPVEVALDAAEVEVEVPFYRGRTGGLGVQIGRVDGGIEVSRVFADTPADEMGLEAGDVIVEVDGHSVAGMSVNTFIAYMTGPEGSEVNFVLSTEGETGFVEEALSIERRFLGDS